MTSLLGLVTTNGQSKPKIIVTSDSIPTGLTTEKANGNANGHKNGTNANQNGELHPKKNTKSAKNHLPLGMKCLVDEFFVPGAKGFFEIQPRLPLLKSTNLSILRQTKANSKANGHIINDLLRDLHGKPLDINGVGDNLTNSGMSLVHSTWEIILSFMEDEHEQLDKGQNTRLFESTVHARRKQFLSKKRLWRKPSFSKTPVTSEVNKRPVSMFVIGGIEPKNQSAFTQEELSSMTVLEKVRFVTNAGLENPFMKDEIFCQILKQLVSNSSPRSSALGWILLALVASCFSPTKKILPYVEEFIDQHHSVIYSHYCKQKLHLLIHGDRQNPPCSLELQAAKSRSEMRIPVICMDQSVRSIYVNSSTTAHEVCRMMAAKNRLGDSFGFSLCIALNNKLVTLGNGNFYIMDAISQAEQFTRINDVHEVWRIYYRREFFSPRDAGGIQANQMKTWLTYSQICGGVQSGEYQINKAQDLALLLAHQYCVRHSIENKIDMKKVMAVCDHNLPQNVYKDDKKKKWCLMVYTTLEALSKKPRSSTNDIMQQVIRYASKSFINNFTKSFTLSSFKEKDGVALKGKFQLKINHEQVTINQLLRSSIGEDSNKVVVVIPVVQLKNVEVLKNSMLRTPHLEISLFNGKNYLLGSIQAWEIVNILSAFVKEIITGANNESAA